VTWLRPQPQSIPHPRPSLTAAPFWAGTAQHELRFQDCLSCGRATHTPALVCEHCGSWALRWDRSSGRGVVYSWTIVWRPQTPQFEIPYVPIIVDMEEGWQMLSSLIDCDHLDVHIGQTVEVAFHLLDESVTLPYFRPAGEANPLRG